MRTLIRRRLAASGHWSLRIRCCWRGERKELALTRSASAASQAV